MQFKDELKKINACEDAVKWVDGRSMRRAYRECKRADWLLWYFAKQIGQPGWPARQEIVLAACDCAELTLPRLEKTYPKDKRPRVAIETARKWAAGKATLEEVRAAADAAHAAAYDAAAAAYAYAADAAAASYAAAAARSNAHLNMCALIRKRLKLPKVRAAKGKK